MIKVSVIPSSDGPEHPTVPKWRICFAGGLLAALLFLAIWLPTHPARPLLPTDDLYTHLGVARNLARGEGFRTDMIYPLSFAFPFARELPQPLIHRGPGFPLLLTLPHLAGGENPRQVLEAVRILQLVLLGLTIWIGSTALLARGRKTDLGAWLILLGVNPMMVYAVDWGYVELVCSLLLFVLWLRIRDRGENRPSPRFGIPSGVVDGLLIGFLALLRMDLFWVPLLWIVVLRRSEHRRLVWALLIFALTIAPWAVRNYRLTGDAFFSLQGQAELVKMTPAWPEYSVYRQLDPQPALESMRATPVPILRKIARGVKFQILNLGRFLPSWYWVGLVILFLLAVARRSARFSRGMLRGPDLMQSLGVASARPVPLLVAVASLGLLIVQYSFFDHSLRHLLVLLPVLAWELAPWTGTLALKQMEQRAAFFRIRTRGITGLLAAAVLTTAGALLFPCSLPGWDGAAEYAEEVAPKVDLRVKIARQAPDEVLFVEWPAVPYFCGRSAVWAPTDQQDREKIREFLSP